MLKLLLLLALPTAVIVYGGRMMSSIVGRNEVTRQLSQNAAKSDQMPPFRRAFGYNAAQLKCHWDALDNSALEIEQRFLKLDLAFPFLYGAALTGALVVAWAALGHQTKPVWPILTVLIAIVADWVENIVGLSQLSQYMHDRESGLQAGWVAVASIATSVKWVFLVLSLLRLVFLVASIYVHSAKSPT